MSAKKKKGGLLNSFSHMVYPKEPINNIHEKSLSKEIPKQQNNARNKSYLDLKNLSKTKISNRFTIF